MRLHCSCVVASIALGLSGCKMADEEMADADLASSTTDTAPAAVADAPPDRPAGLPDSMRDLATPDSQPPDAMAKMEVARDTRPPDAAPCGKKSQACCPVIVNGDPGDACPEKGTRCSVNKVCLTCGATGQPCCRAVGGVTNCQSGLDCVGADPDKENPGLCQACGASGQVCCSGINRPTCRTNLGCNDPTGVQAQSKCSSCGALNATCCDGDNCQVGGRCVGAVNNKGGTCRVCGKVGGICCKSGICDDGMACAYDAGGNVLCLLCGDTGQPCCGEGSCAAGLTCKNPVGQQKNRTCS